MIFKISSEIEEFVRKGFRRMRREGKCFFVIQTTRRSMNFQGGQQFWIFMELKILEKCPVKIKKLENIRRKVLEFY